MKSQGTKKYKKLQTETRTNRKGQKNTIKDQGNVQFLTVIRNTIQFTYFNSKTTMVPIGSDFFDMQANINQLIPTLYIEAISSNFLIN